MLAYVFWHRPRAGVDDAEYVAALTAFHERIGVPSWFATLRRPPWGEHAGWYEDWYLVEDWNELGRLNEMAITGARQPPHNVAAALAGEGIAGIYGLIGGRPEPPEWAAWVTKPRGAEYADFESKLVGVGAAGSVWKRQMTLGPTPEFVVLAPLPLALPWPTVETGPG